MDGGVWIWQPTPVFLPGESQGWRAWWAAVYGVAQSRIRLKRLSSSSSRKGPSGEGDGTPLQYSCWENPMDGGAWWAVVCGVAKSRTQLKRLGRLGSNVILLNPLQYSCLENSMDRGAWWAVVHGVTKSWAWLSDWTTIISILYLVKIYW